MKKNLAGYVPMPTAKITFKKGANGTEYVYRTTKAYRNSRGRPTSDEVAIGKKDKASGMLIPNARYFDYYPDAAPVANPPLAAKDYGSCRALGLMADMIGLTGIVSRAFPETWQELMACAMYMSCEGNVMMYIDDWCDMTETPYGLSLDPRRCGELFASISHSERTWFFEGWAKARSEQEYIAYDVTSISTGAKNISIAEWGYNRDGDGMPQINLGMFYGETSRLPVYYVVYNGSVPDKSSQEFMSESAKSVGIHNVRYVMDRGFIDESNLKYMHDGSMPFIVPMPLYLLDALWFVDEYKEGVRAAENWIAEHEIYGRTYRWDLYGFPLHAHLFFSPDRCSEDEKNLHARVARLAKELGSLDVKRLPKKYTDFFSVSKPAAGPTSFEMDGAKFNAHLQRAGYFVFLTTDLTLTPHGLINIYKGRDIIEKAFCDLKNSIDFRRLRTHTDRTTEGKIFVGFLSLILRSHILSKIKARKETERLTVEKVLLELRKIKVFDMLDGSRLTSTLTKTQKDILSSLGLAETSFAILPRQAAAPGP